MISVIAIFITVLASNLTKIILLTLIFIIFLNYYIIFGDQNIRMIFF